MRHSRTHLVCVPNPWRHPQVIIPTTTLRDDSARNGREKERGCLKNMQQRYKKHTKTGKKQKTRRLVYLNISLASSATAQPSRCTSSMHSATARSPSLSSSPPSPSWDICCWAAALVKRDRNRRSATLLSGALRATTRIMLTGHRRRETRAGHRGRGGGLVGGSERRRVHLRPW